MLQKDEVGGGGELSRSEGGQPGVTHSMDA